MFNYRMRLRIKQLTDRLQIEHEANNHLNNLNDRLINLLHNNCCLVAMRKEGNQNIFTFVRNGKTFEIVMSSSAEDKFNEWATNAGLNDGG